MRQQVPKRPANPLMKSTRRDTSQKRKSILDAAVQAFGDEGYDGTSMDRIAELAGASKRTVYNHFSSKDELFEAVMDEFAREMGSLKRISYDVARSLEEQLSDFADAELALVNSPTRLGLLKVVLGVFMRDPERARATIARYTTCEAPLVSWLRAATQDGRLAVDDPKLAAEVFSSMMGGAFTLPAVYQGQLKPGGVQALKEELIETFLCRYRTSPVKARTRGL